MPPNYFHGNNREDTNNVGYLHYLWSPITGDVFMFKIDCLSISVPSITPTSDGPIYPTPPLGQDMTQGQFLSGVWQVWIQGFPSPRLVASPRLKNLVCPIIYP